VHGWVLGSKLMCSGCLASVRDPVSIGDQRLFETRRLLEHGHQNPQRLLETGIYLIPVV